MATTEMIKFYKGLEASLPAAGVSGALYITTDEGGIYLGTGTGMKRLGDFVQVANVASLPAKAHESCLYYCVAENILAKWNGTEWKQINKQPTAEELKTLLGLGSMAYVSTVVESNLSAELQEKINASAEGNHSHSNKTVLDGITAEKVSAWDAAEGNAKTYADGLDSAMNTRVEALEAIDHDHANKAELDLIASGDKAKWDAAEAKAHTHTFNETELNKIVEGDVAKWNGVVADHLTSADKATLEAAIKEAKKAGTDANTNIETYKVSNDARVLAVEEDIAELTDGTNGILAQAKSYSDGKLATARTEITAEIDADVKVVADDLAGYKTSNDAALAGVKATAEAAATKTYTDTELAKKVDKVTGKSLVDDAEITKLAGVSAGANKVEASENNGYIKIDGVETTVYTHPEKHTVSEISDFDEKVKAYGYATTTEAQAMADGKDAAIAEAKKAGTDAQTYAEGVAGDLATHITTADGKFETKTDASAKLTEAKGYTDTEVAKVQGEVDALETYVGTIPTDEKYADITSVVAYIDKKAEETLAAASGNSNETAASVKAQLDEYKEDNDARVEAAEKAIDAIEEDYLKAADKTELSEAIGAEKTRAEGIEAGLRTDVDAIKGDYLKKADKDELQGNIDTVSNAVERLTNGVSADEVDGVNDLIAYVKEHGPEVTGMQEDIAKNAEDIAKNAKAIADNATTAAETYETKADATSKKTEIDGRLDALEGKVDVTKVSTAISEAVKAEADRATEAEEGLAGRIKDLEDNKAGYATTSEVATAKSEAIAAAETKATELDNALKTALQAEIDADVKALADGQVNTNKEDIASLFEQLTWGSF